MSNLTVQRTQRSRFGANPKRGGARSSAVLSPIELPRPRLRSGKSLPEALRRRATVREIGDRKLPLQMLSNLLWAACGVNRPKGPFGGQGITAASASNGRGQKDAAMKAPVQIVYVVDVHRLSQTSGFQEPGLQDPEVQKSYYFVDTGLIAGNVYLFAASQGLAAWFHNCDRAGLFRALKLRSHQRVLFGQTVGYPERRRRSKPLLS